MEKKSINKELPEVWEGKAEDYELGSEENGWKIISENSNTSINLEAGVLSMDNANWTYQDENGNKITRERYYELRVEKLEKTVFELEEKLLILSESINQKADVSKVVSAINTSPEGIRFSGKKIHINGETLLDN